MPDGSPSVLQFELKKVFVLVTIAALLCLSIAPLIRSLDTDQQLRLFRLSIPVAIAAGSVGTLTIHRRYRSERQFGACIAKVAMTGKATRWFMWAFPVFMGFALGAILYLQSLYPPVPLPGSSIWIRYMTEYFTLPMFGVSLVMSVLHAWWGRVYYVELCERGIIMGGLAGCQWSALRFLHWNRDTGKLSLGVGTSSKFLKVPPDDRQFVAEFLGSKGLLQIPEGPKLH